MIDLHTHTIYSDGKDDVITLLKEAEKAKLECISITDHSSCKAYEEIDNMDVSKYYSGKIVRGCELFTTINGAVIELLGYNVDTDLLNKELPNMHKYTLEDMKKIEINKTIEICKKNGITMNEKNIDFNSIYASTEIHKEITSYDENKKNINDERAWENSYVFYREFMSNPDSLFFIDKSELFPSLDEVIEIIKKTNGLVFIPHIFVYGDNSLKFLEELTKNHNIDGIECYYSTFTDEQTRYLLKLCEERNLYVSGGSDYHGSAKPNINIGIGQGNLNIPFDIIEKWARI